MTKEIKSKQDFTVLAIPGNKPFVVAPDKVEHFKKQKPDPEIRKQTEEIANKLNITDKTNGPILKKTFNPKK